MATPYIKTLYNKTKTYIWYPRTKTAAVLLDDNTTTLSTKLSNMDATDNAKGYYLKGTATLAVASWTGSGPYTCAITASGVKSGDTPTVDCVTGTDLSAASLINSVWEQVANSGINPQVSADTIVFYTIEKPSVAIPIKWEVTHL